MAWPSAVAHWGSTAAERSEPLACDRLIPVPDHVLFRAVDVDAPVEVTFRWLCQLRAAPYSYDKLDNFGRRSPQTLTPGLDSLAPGQRFQTIFHLVTFESGKSLTMVSDGPVFGRLACTYRADAMGERRSRIVVKLLVVYPRGPHGALFRFLGPPGDLVMMRRQLLNLRDLAERQTVTAQ
jgi:hypothetical protein